MKVIKHFLEFLKTFDFHQVHNMLALMLNFHFKSLWVAKHFVGGGNTISLVEYDVKKVIHLLMIIFNRLNLIVEIFVTPCDGKVEK